MSAPHDAGPATPGTSSGSARARVPWWRARRGLVVALAISLAVHLAISLVPEELSDTPDATPLTATLRELPPPPAPAPQKPKPKPRPKAPAPVAAPVPAPVPVEPPAEPAPEAVAEQASDAVPAAEPAPEPEAPPVFAEDIAPPDEAPVERKTLPPRVDLAYKVFYGTQGFHIGSATYRFEHADNRYRIATVGEARGLAALILRGQGRMESRGLITESGLQPQELVVDKFNRRGSERAEFDWETGIATLHDNQTAALELPTFDALTLMWQFYFQPPDGERQSFAFATTRRVFRATVARERYETIDWANGPVDTEVWHRTSEDGRTEAWVWLAPSLRWIPVKLRVTNTTRGTIEAVLDAIRVDETVAAAP